MIHALLFSGVALANIRRRAIALKKQRMKLRGQQGDEGMAVEEAELGDEWEEPQPEEEVEEEEGSEESVEGKAEEIVSRLEEVDTPTPSPPPCKEMTTDEGVAEEPLPLLIPSTCDDHTLLHLEDEGEEEEGAEEQQPFLIEVSSEQGHRHSNKVLIQEVESVSNPQMPPPPPSQQLSPTSEPRATTAELPSVQSLTAQKPYRPIIEVITSEDLEADVVTTPGPIPPSSPSGEESGVDVSSAGSVEAKMLEEVSSAYDAYEEFEVLKAKELEAKKPEEVEVLEAKRLEEVEVLEAKKPEEVEAKAVEVLDAEEVEVLEVKKPEEVKVLEAEVEVLEAKKAEEVEAKKPEVEVLEAKKPEVLEVEEVEVLASFKGEPENKAKDEGGVATLVQGVEFGQSGSVDGVQWASIVMPDRHSGSGEPDGSTEELVVEEIEDTPDPEATVYVPFTGYPPLQTTTSDPQLPPATPSDPQILPATPSDPQILPATPSDPKLLPATTSQCLVQELSEYKFSDVPLVDQETLQQVDTALQSIRGKADAELTEEEKVWRLAACGGSSLQEDRQDLDPETSSKLKQTLKQAGLLDKVSLKF